MNVSSPALPIAPASSPATSSLPSGGNDSAAPENFESLLSDNSGKNSNPAKSDDSGAGLGQNATASQNTDSEEETTDGVPTPAEQINLAALLYAPQMTPLPTPTPLGDSICVANPATEDSASFSAGNQNLPLFQAGQSADGEASTNPVLANVELPTTPVAASGFQVPKPTTSAVETATMPQTTLSVAVQAPAMAATTASQAPVATAPISEAPAQSEATPLPSDATAIAGVPMTEESVPAITTEAPELPVAEAEFTPANSAENGVTGTLVQANSAKTASTANTDAHLVSEQPTAQQTPRGTSSAKAVREMKSPTAATTDSSPESTTRPVTLEKGAQGETSSDQQDAPTADNSATKQTGTETFSVSTAVHAAKSEAISKAALAAPVTPAAVVHEVNQGLERIQQSGHDRMDLRLTLEGGGEVSIALQVRDGAVHAAFQTNSPEMREALQKNWAQMAARSENLSIPLAEPTFKSSNNNSGNFFQQQDPRDRQEASQGQGQWQGQGNPRTAFQDNAAAQSAKRVAPAATPVRRASSGLNLYA